MNGLTGIIRKLNTKENYGCRVRYTGVMLCYQGERFYFSLGPWGGGGGEGGGVRACWRLNIPATCECISWMDLHRQVYVLPY